MDARGADRLYYPIATSFFGVEPEINKKGRHHASLLGE
jgi:hypothetical protein